MTTIRFFFLAIGMLWGVSACGDSDGPTDPPVPTSLRVSPTSTTLHALGASAQFTATVHDQNGNAMADVGVSWVITDPSVATVTGNGLVTAVGNGNTTVAASAATATGNAGVLVDQLVADIRVSPGGDTLVALGDTVRLTAEGTDANRHSVGGAEFTWLSGDSLVVTVDGSGLVTAAGDGGTTVTAQADGATGSAAIVVQRHATNMTVSPARTTLRAIGDTVRLIAEALDANGRALTEAGFQWTTLNDSVVSVDSVGLVTAIANGTTVVTAARDDRAAIATVTVAQMLASVIVSPSRITLEEGDTIRLRARSLDTNGHELVAAAHEWVSSDESVASVDSTGLVRARVVGTALVSASADTLSGVAEITVRLPHVPPNPAVDEGTSHSLQASGIRVDHALTRRTRTGTSHAVVYADLDSDGDTDLFYAPLNRTLNPLPPEVFLKGIISLT